ncbi:flagellar basal-body MS-ring/collar protein FliF [Alkaliphilus peptidifermentans]|uniref:Flagellar M-ring protein n=1 Tax=Alkaliphilus peptidifermentans DSM 18978 TaxID=1120976 RepID=A0A1G5DIJ2_9FIRM|nr:flagellar basal-body MS-ring/collar protein FliF [Alkaliphilus peptidifermentans]SCY14436.1 flagellar M-ring protein FliF [Alkaliphilus peptidifermentans DSM 18978]
MTEAVETMRNQLSEYFQGMEKRQMIKLALAAIFILLALTAMILLFTRTEYVVLYYDLDAKQAGEVLNTLESNNIKARFGDSSGTILVAKQDEKRAQVVVATQGLPTARFSFEDAFTNSFMMTSEERTQRFQYAQQNYLASTIEEIPGIRKAVVHLTVPEKSGFIYANDDRMSKASVFLDLETRANLDNNSISGIVLLVSNAVQGLSPENVTVHGTDGRVLNQRNESGDAAFSVNDQINLQHAVKNDLENSITDFLSTVYGYGNVAVMANVKLDFDSEITEIMEFSPPIDGETTGIIRSMQELQQNVVNEAIGGIPGTDSNTDDITQYAEYDPNVSRYSEASRTINYEINELRQKIVKAQGQVQDITIAVYINSNSLNGGRLTDEERRELQNIISAAAGLDTRVVQVGVQQFSSSLEDQLRSALEGSNVQTGLGNIPIWLWGIVAALILGSAYFASTKLRKKKVEPIDSIREIIPQEELEEIDLQLAGSMAKQQIEKMVSKKPDAVAQLLRNWLSED